MPRSSFARAQQLTAARTGPREGARRVKIEVGRRRGPPHPGETFLQDHLFFDRKAREFQPFFQRGGVVMALIKLQRFRRDPFAVVGFEDVFPFRR